MQSQELTPSLRYRDVILRVDGQEHVLGTLSSELTLIQNPTGNPATDPTASFAISQDLRGTTGELIFRLSVPATQPAYESRIAKVWLDNVTVLTAQPLATEHAGQATDVGSTTVPQGTVDTLAEAARLWWTGLIQSPDGILELSTGSIGTAAANFLGSSTGSNGGNDNNLWNAGFGEGGFNNQLLFMNHGSTFSVTVPQSQVASGIGINLVAGAPADKGGIYDNAPVSTNRHPVQAHSNSDLIHGQHAAFTPLVTGIVDEGVSLETHIVENVASIDESTVQIADVNIRFNSSASSSELAISNLKVFNLDRISLEPFQHLAGLADQLDALEVVDPFLHFREQGASGQGDQGQDQQQLLQHNLSFGTLTLPPDRNLVNNSEAISSQPSALSFDQLALLNRATISIADLADGYLALTLGTTITLDTDAAGYGWFIDPTPFTNEEFVSLSAWELEAAKGSGAENKIDLMTVLMHELGHVMGLGHVSSAVDGTRLMAGSIDPGIRRLPSMLDLGEPSHQHSAVSDQPVDQATIWDPYLAHYSSVQPSAFSLRFQRSILLGWCKRPTRPHTSGSSIRTSPSAISNQPTTAGMSPAQSRLPTGRPSSPKTATSSPPCPRPLPCRTARRTCASQF